MGCLAIGSRSETIAIVNPGRTSTATPCRSPPIVPHTVIDHGEDWGQQRAGRTTRRTDPDARSHLHAGGVPDL